MAYEVPKSGYSQDPFQVLSRAWMRNIKLAVETKAIEFSKDAAEAMRFFDGPHDFMYKSTYASKSSTFQLAGQENRPSPTFRMTFNKVAEFVHVFGPHLYHTNPFRQVTPRKVMGVPAQALVGTPAGEQIQQLQQMLDQQNQQTQMVDELRANLLSSYLNYTPNEMDLKTHSRLAIDEALIKGLSTLWIEVYIPEGTQQRFVRSVFDSVDNLVVDPDMESIPNAKWIARRRVLPTWEVENRFGLKAGSIKGTLQSIGSQSYEFAAADAESEYYKSRGQSNDLLVFWEVFSRMGAGHLMQQPQATYWPDRGGPFKKYLDQFGSYCYLVVCDEYPYPLNLPEKVVERGNRDEIFNRLQWPTPFWADPANPWPMSHLEFHPRPRKVWPMSHLKPAMGEVQFLNWAFSFMADKIKNTSRDFIAIRKQANEDMKTAILSGRDLSLIEISKMDGGKTINDVVQFLQHPQMNGDIWMVIEAVIGLFEQRTGLSELLASGTTKKQLRSAEEARVKSEMVQIRPDDMANRVEDWQTAQARKEALAARWHIREEDVLPMMGEAQAALWGKFVSSAEIHSVTQELEYRIESGSIRKPNKERNIANANAAVQMWGPVLQNFAQATGQYGPLNGLSSYWAKANDMDPKIFQMEPPPPEPPQPDPTKMQEIQSKMQIEAAKLQLERQKMEMEAAGSQQELVQDQQSHGMEMEKARFDLSAVDQEAALKMQLARLEHEQKEDEGELEMDMLELKLDAMAEEQRIKQAGMRLANRLQKQKAAAGNGKK